MDLKKKVTISWSGGKDSALALYKIFLAGRSHEVSSLHTVINTETRRVGMHGVHEALMEAQAESLGIPLIKLYLDSSETHEGYRELMTDFYQRCSEQKITSVIFGDIFLEDLRIFREALLRTSGLEGVFPLWKKNTVLLLNDFIQAGFKTVLCAADAKFFSREQVGQVIDHHFVPALAPGVDPCGENGEFHTFTFDGPIFKKPISFQLGPVQKKIYRYLKTNEQGKSEEVENAFWFQDFSF